MKLRIISPTSKKEHAIAWIELQTATGSIIIQPGHAPTIVTLKKHAPIKFTYKTGKQESVTLVKGVAHVTRNEVTIIAHAI